MHILHTAHKDKRHLLVLHLIFFSLGVFVIISILLTVAGLSNIILRIIYNIFEISKSLDYITSLIL